MEPEQIINFVRDRLEDESIDAFEICFLGTEHLAVEARDGQVESFSSALLEGVAIRAVKDQRIGWASSTDLSDTALLGLVSAALANVKEVASSEESVIPKPSRKGSKQAQLKISEKEGKPLKDIPELQKIAVALELERVAKATDPRIVRVRQPLYEESIRRVVIYNSHGVRQNASRQIVSCEVRAIAQSNNVSESGYDFSFSPRFEDLDIEGTAVRAARRSLALLGASPLPTGRYDVVFEPRPAASLLRLLAPSFFADNVQRKKSAIAEKKGKSVYHSLVTIIDDGLLPDGYGSFPFDDEGVPRRKVVLVRDGVIFNWLYDTQRAAREGKLSTGSSFRPSIHKLPSISVSNCYIKSGDSQPAALFSMIKNGFLVTDIMGLHTANPVTGDFSLGAEGFCLDGGQKGRPVRGVIVAGNVHELFGKVAGVGTDLKFIGNYGAPSILVSDIQVSGAS